MFVMAANDCDMCQEGKLGGVEERSRERRAYRVVLRLC